ncbi:DUF456 domain-containing protein [Falsibacillus albus]|uniref:DUF456 domain-containing protein n=1 Tax=Falsibacillus albus TaxID=2478915 RepID=A0A3L7K7K4_9BACI|nr:DUF456 domain-containing protein [Falsibacillus albus]RLQ98214.1 DUF456 domain-containing protein [Falsibacillus albus]
MEWLYWTIITILFLISFVGLIYPIIPSVLFIVAGYLLYGAFFSFNQFGWVFWSVQLLFTLLLFAADYLANALGIKKSGGTRAGVWGSTIGLLIGPFIIPVAGILAGPFLGAVLAEIIVHRTNWKKAVKIGIGSLVGFVSSILTKGIIQLVMIGYFLLRVFS